MKPTDTPNTPDGSIPTPGSYPLYEYPAYTFDRKYENDEFQKKVITLDSGKHSKKCTFYTLRFGCSFAAVNTIKPQLL